MPLDSNNEPARYVFHGFNNPIGSFRRNTQVASWTFNALVVEAVDLHIEGSVTSSEPREETSCFQPDGMSGFVMCQST